MTGKEWNILARIILRVMAIIMAGLSLIGWVFNTFDWETFMLLAVVFLSVAQEFNIVGIESESSVNRNSNTNASIGDT